MAHTYYFEKEPKKHEDFLKATVGDFGCWQFKISLLMALLKFPIAWFQLSIVFLAPPTQFWCAPPQNYAKVDREKWIDIVSPKGNDSLQHEGLNSGYCEMLDLKNTGTIPCVNGYEYNRTVFKSSIISEWDLVCGHQRFIDLTQITLMLGVLIGNMVFGILADRKGRKSILILCIFFQSIFSLASAWIPWYWGFVLVRFLMAVANGGTMVTSFVMCMEIVGGKWRTIVPILYQIPFGFGNSIMSGLAYLLRDWRQFQMAISSLSALYIFYFWLIPESPRWLVATGKKIEAMVILQKAAKINKMNPERIATAMTDLSNLPQETQRSSFSALFSTPTLRKRSFLLCLNWTIAGITFYAFSQYLGHVTQNLYFTVAVGGLIALPGTIFCIYVVSHFGRRLTVACAHFLTATCFLAILFVPKGMFVHDWPRIAFSGLGIIGLSISMPALYLFTGELYPTVLRNAGVGASVMFSRIGSMIAPTVIALEGTSTYLPLVILAVAALSEALLVIPLPETKGQSFPETITDLDDNTNNLDLKGLSDYRDEN